MRALLLVFMIVLMPVRGWMSDVMATQMAGNVAAAVGTVTDEPNAAHHPTAERSSSYGHKALVAIADAAAAGMSADCIEHASKQADEQTEASCNNCVFCQACHTVALTESGASMVAAFLPSSAPRASLDRFASAEAAIEQKPPIS